MIDFTVNATNFTCPDSDTATYDYIVTLATIGGRRRKDALYTVTYDNGKGGGTLRPGESVKLVEGMHFDATVTGDA